MIAYKGLFDFVAGCKVRDCLDLDSYAIASVLGLLESVTGYDGAIVFFLCFVCHFVLFLLGVFDFQELVERFGQGRLYAGLDLDFRLGLQ